MSFLRLAIIFVLILNISGCVMLKQDEWARLQQDVNDLKREMDESRKTKESLENLKTKLEELQKTASVQLASKVSLLEGIIEKDLRKRQADTSADITALRSDFQMLTGRFEEIRFSIQKSGQEGKGLKDELDARLKETGRSLDDIQNRLSNIEQAIAILRQDMEKKKESPQEIEAAAEEAYKEAYEIYKNGDFKASREAFLKMLERFPSSKLVENAHYWIGETYYSEKNFERAIVEFDDVVRKFPESPKAPAALLKQGMAFSALGDKKNANAIYKAVIERYPKSEQADTAKKRLKEK